MLGSPPVPRHLCVHFGILTAERLAETAIARIYKVVLKSGQTAVLKLYHDRAFANERPGVELMAHWASDHVVRVWGMTDGAVLMEWLDGPSLGDLARNGQEEAAAIALADVARNVHACPPPSADDLPTLHRWFEALFALRFAPACPGGLQRDVLRAQTLARALLDGAQPARALHGDLHYENVRASERGYVAFDAKGLWGDPAYELANAFRHPLNRLDQVGNPARIARLAALWSDALGVSQRRLLEWAAAKCALSMAWRQGPVLADDGEAALLNALLRQAQSA